MKRLNELINIVVLTGALLGAVSITAAYSVGDTVADFTLPDADGHPVSLSDFAGSVVMINFWTSG